MLSALFFLPHTPPATQRLKAADSEDRQSSMCVFTFTYFECGHRGEDHIDTSTCKYFKRTGVHCQDDNPQHRLRPGGTTIEVKKSKEPGNCVKCFRVEQEAIARALDESKKTADEEEKRRQERERAEHEARRKQKRAADEERADNVEKARLAKGRQQFEQNEAEQKRKRDAKIRAAAAEKRRQEDADKKAKRDAKQKQEKQDADLAEKRRQQELAEAREQIAREDELEQERKRQEKVKKNAERKEAEHQESLRRLKEDADRKRAEDNKAERRRAAAEERRREESELERRQREINAQNVALEKAAQEAEEGEEDAEHAKRVAQMEADVKAAERELQRKLAQRRVVSETEPTSPTPTEQALPLSRLTSPSTRSSVDYGVVIGHHGPQELGHGMLGGRRIPLHESQKRPEPLKTPISPPIKRGPAAINRLGGTIDSSPYDYKIQQPSLVATPGMPTPDWRKNARPTSASRSIPTPEPTGATFELEARLAKRRAWEAEQEKLEAEKTEPDWEIVNQPANSSAIPTKPTSPALQAPTMSTSPPPTYPVVPPLAHPKLGFATPSPSPAISKPKPPVPVKRIPSTSSPSQMPSIPTPPPLPSLPTRLRIDSAAPSPQVGSKRGDDWDDDESEDEDRFGNDGAWDDKMTRKQFSAEDVFGEQRRKGWRME
ncbi:uncharacterized protein M421DRAFT_418588 [Didymella exigua CBS 183.55]|uniref:Uncharacterized protein n=1 Tax=Didymella exigua CBS 183.55 TaxID=1150837 RepID=A0A6A5RR76_9PLEO|nr:uncharacterized protein M421DRAFT_418588 [Didymella exigua CBS 183.55]KAF1930272.1 hypothetical protein M421DRAFT_418588 [Didymella exigua CBS 183.55]